MSTPSVESLYLRDLGSTLKEMALKAREDKNAASDENRDYSLGRLMAMHEVISLMQQQAVAFDLDLRTLNLQDVDPDRDLL